MNMHVKLTVIDS